MNTKNAQLKTEIRAPKGTKLSCKGWHQEAAMRMLMNNLDPDVAEKPDELVVYGGTGKAARNHDCLARIISTLKRLENDETLLIQSGKPVGVFQTHDEAPRVLIANAHLVPRWAALSGNPNDIYLTDEAVLAIEWLTAAQALDFRRPLKPGRGVEAGYNCVRSLVPQRQIDHCFKEDLNLCLEIVGKGQMIEVVEKLAGELN